MIVKQWKGLCSHCKKLEKDSLQEVKKAVYTYQYYKIKGQTLFKTIRSINI